MAVEKNNQRTSKARIVGIIEEDLILSYELSGRKFYLTRVIVKRKNLIDIDYVPITVAEDKISEEIKKGSVVEVKGVLRTYKVKDIDGKQHDRTCIYVHNISCVKCEKPVNEVMLIGRVMKKPFYKVTQKGYHLTALSLMVEGKKDFWDPINLFMFRDAKYLKEGDIIKIKGRMQSRRGDKVNRIFYEIYAENYIEM